MKMKYILASLFLIGLSSSPLFAQGNGIQNIANYGGNGGDNEFFRESNGQEYFTTFDKTPLDTNKSLQFETLKVGVEEGAEVGFEKDFKNNRKTGFVVPFASEDYVDLVSSDVKIALNEKSSDYGFKTGNGGVVASGVLKDIQYNFTKKKGIYRKLSLNCKVEWQFKKDSKVIFSATTSGYYLNLSEKNADIKFGEAFNIAISETLDKVFSIEDFRKAFAL